MFGKKFFAPVLILIFLLCSCSRSASTGNSDGKSLAERDQSVLSICTALSYQPFEYLGDEGELLGFDMALAMLMAEAMDRRPVFCPMDSDSLLSALNCGLADIALCRLEATDVGRRTADFSDSYITIASAIVTNREYTKVTGTDSLREAEKIAAVYGSYSYEYLRAIGLDNIGEYRNFNQCVGALLRGDAEVMFADTGDAEAFIAEYPEFVIRETDIDRRRFSVAVADGNSELVREINSILAQFRTDGTLLSLRRAYINGDDALRAEYDERLKQYRK